MILALNNPWRLLYHWTEKPIKEKNLGTIFELFKNAFSELHSGFKCSVAFLSLSKLGNVPQFKMARHYFQEKTFTYFISIFSVKCSHSMIWILSCISFTVLFPEAVKQEKYLFISAILRPVCKPIYIYTYIYIYIYMMSYPALLKWMD